MAQVEVIKAVEGPILRKRDYEGNPLVITRQRVAAYVRVSTDDDEQLESFQSQKKYYQEKIEFSVSEEVLSGKDFRKQRLGYGRHLCG